MNRIKDKVGMSARTMVFAIAILAFGLTLLFMTSAEESSATPDQVLYDSNDNTYEFTYGSPNILEISASSTGHTGSGTTGVFSTTYSVKDMFSDVEKVVIADDIIHIGDHTFRYCTLLQTVELPSTLQSIGANAFEGCSNLTSVTIPNDVTSIGDSAFDFCEELATVSIGAGVQTIGDSVFRSCYNITSLTVDPANDYFRVGISNDLLSSDCTTLLSCPSAVSYAIPYGVAIVCDHAFDYNVNLTDVSVPSSVVTLGECPFKVCYNLQSITVDENNTEYKDLDGVLFNKVCTELIAYPSYKSGDSYEIPSTVQGIAKYAFHTCRILSSVTVPASVIMINEYALSSYASPPILSSITFLGSTPAENYCEYGYAKLYVPDVVTYRTAWSDYSSYIYQKIAYDSGDTKYDGNPRTILDTAQVTIDSGTNTATNAGDYSVTATPKYSDGYVWDDGSYTARTISWSIKPITITSIQLELIATVVDYDGNVHIPSFGDFYFDTDPSTPALTSSDVSISLKSGSDGKNVGVQYVIVSAANSNYEVAPDAGAEQSFEIYPIDLTLTPNSGQSKTYNGTTEYELEYTCTGNVAGEVPCISGKFSVSDKNVGTRTIGLGTVQLADSGSFTASNYTLKFDTTPVSMTITKTALEVTADDKTITYGDLAPTYTASYDGFVNGEDVSVLGGSLSLTCDYNYYDADHRNAGAYLIFAGGLTSDNYDISFTGGFLFVDMLIAELSWHLNDYTSDLVYTGFEKGLVAWVDNSLFADVVNVTVSLTPGKDNVNVGKFTYLAQYIDNGNYDVSASGMPVESPEFEITAADIEGTLVQTGTLTYTGSPLAATAGGLETVDSEPLVMTYCTTSAGTYGGMPEFTDADKYVVYYKANAPNHNEKSGSFTVTILKAKPVKDDFIITYPELKDRVYDGGGKSIVVCGKTGLIGMGTFSVQYTGATGIGDIVNAGTVCPVLFIDEGSNYQSEVIVLDSFEILRAVLPAIPEKTVSYNGSYNFSTENFVTGVKSEEITLRYQSSSANADRYHADLAENYFTIWYVGIQNYDFSTVGDLVIDPATLTVTPNPGQEKTYLTDDPALTFTYYGQLPPTTPGFKGALVRDAGENCGPYEIRIGSLELTDNGDFIASNYAIDVVSGIMFNIVPKALQPADFNVDLCDETYTGSEITKTVTSALKVGTDYTMVYENNIFVGEALIWINGIGNYEGLMICGFNIIKRTVSVPEELYYVETGEEISFELPVSDYYTETTGRPQKGTDAGTYSYEFLLDPNCEWSVSGYNGTFNVYITEESVAEIDEDGNVIVVITGSKGVRSDLTLNVKATDDVSEIEKRYEFKNGKARYCYDLTFTKDGKIVQPVGKITVDLLIPKDLRMIPFDIYHIHDGTATKMDKTVSGDYATVETDSFSEFVFVSNFDLKTLAVFGAALAIITLVSLYLICIRKGKGHADDAKPSRSERNAKKKAEKKAGSK